MANNKNNTKHYGTEGFEKVIQEHLNTVAQSSPAFAERLARADKNIADCANYCMFKAFELKAGIMTNDEVFSNAVHYYEEDKLEEGFERFKSNMSNNSLAIMSSCHTFVSDEEKDEIRQLAKDQAKDELKQEALKKAKDDIRNGNSKIDLSDEISQQELREAARQKLIDDEAERQKKNTVKRTAVKKAEKQPEDDGLGLDFDFE